MADNLPASAVPVHSPLPWTQSSLMVSDARGSHVAHCTKWSDGKPLPDEAVANGAFIVTACNSHHELLAALTTVRDDADTFDIPNHVLARINAAIAKATSHA